MINRSKLIRKHAYSKCLGLYVLDYFERNNKDGETTYKIPLCYFHADTGDEDLWFNYDPGVDIYYEDAVAWDAEYKAAYHKNNTFYYMREGARRFGHMLGKYHRDSIGPLIPSDNAMVLLSCKGRDYFKADLR